MLPIHPVFSQQILAGTKTVEFRKRQLADDIATVLIYETSPTMAIVGEFDFTEQVVRAPSTIWRRFGSVGGISRKDFHRYFDGHQQAVAIVISGFRRYPTAIRLSSIDPQAVAPQGVRYVNRSIVDAALSQPSGHSKKLSSTSTVA